MEELASDLSRGVVDGMDLDEPETIQEIFKVGLLLRDIEFKRLERPTALKPFFLSVSVLFLVCGSCAEERQEMTNELKKRTGEPGVPGAPL